MLFILKINKPSSEHQNWKTNCFRHARSYRGPLPKRTLFFGKFLFYSGIIPWEALIKAILWQRNQRPKIGEIAKSWGWLDDDELTLTSRNRNLAEPIGSSAVRLKLLNEGQLRMLLIRQQKLQKPFGANSSRSTGTLP